METLHLLMLQTGRSDFDGLADNSFLGRNALVPSTNWETFTGPFFDDAGVGDFLLLCTEMINLQPIVGCSRFVDYGRL